ncbi:unnamed protein product [Rotaria sordida]|uniref:Sacsin/Nov domain-containing protein n=1 Tax=Rotaria sordida TaxID=392033 RepID=A0A819PNZ0_9BILA|nr:unnamed protein product [Rotaria sordida]
MKAQQGGNEEHVTINLRKLIEGMLAHYSSEFFVFRELIQNADDAKASSFSLEIKCNAPSSSSVEMDFHNHVITEICTTNDGLIFSETDWKRVATIAEGNTDIASVGRFGVGFYSVFSYTEEPIIVSGKEYMIFVWKDNNSLTTLRQQLPIKQQSKTTSIILKMQEKHVLQIESTLDKSRITNKDVPIINLTQLKAYFAKVTEQIFTIVDGPSMTLGRVDVEARLNIDQQFHNHVRRILNKSLPSIVQIQLLFVPIDVIIRHQQQLKSSEVVNDLNIQIFNSILPLKFVDEEIIPAGLIFIGLETHQSAGFGMHVSSHLITTLERENLDLQDPYIKKWNKELLTSIGQIARCIYDQIIIHSSNNIARERYNAVMAPYSFQTSVPNKEIGTTLESTKKTVQKYVPQKLHFPFVAAQLNWSDLLIIDWQDIDPHSSAYAFLKELGVREVPELQKTTTLMKPSEVFIRSIIQKQTTGSTFDDINASGLIDYVDFGPAANSFLINIGVRDFPSASILAELLIDRQANYFANLTGDSETLKNRLYVYTECLKQLAIAVSRTSDLQNEPIQKRLQNEPWCLGIRRLIDPEDDHPENEFKIMRPAEIYLNDDIHCAQNDDSCYSINSYINDIDSDDVEEDRVRGESGVSTENARNEGSIMY